MFREIGSEFWEYPAPENKVHNLPDWLKWGSSNRLFVSGRTALDHIIMDIKAIQPFRAVYMPSYCCRTMIEPFESNRVNVLFYNVLASEKGGLFFDIDYTAECDAVFVMNYFGFISPDTSVIIENFKNHHNKLIIEDATHSLFCSKPFNSDSDYVFSSLRKWFAVPGAALVSKTKAEFVIGKPMLIHNEYIKMKIDGMNLKKAYFNSENVKKDSFLKIFNDAELMLEHDYKNYAIDNTSFSIIERTKRKKIHLKRISNARLLLNALKNQSKFRLLFNDVAQTDCPLFVPLVVESAWRERFKHYLIGMEIFCPVHWPKSDLHHLTKNSKSIYDTELSLVCDQRYGQEDMERIITAIKNF
jgi:hypothetical protein